MLVLVRYEVFEFLTFNIMLDIGSMNSLLDILFEQNNYPVDTGRKLNVHKMFRRRPGPLLNVLCTFNLRPVSTGYIGT